MSEAERPDAGSVNAVSHFTHLACSVCGARSEVRPARFCSDCRAPLVACYDLARARASFGGSRDGASVLASRPRSLWRFAELLPPVAPRSRVTLGEGATPLLRARRLGRIAGLRRLYVKEEGANPTLSFKARGMAVAVSAALAEGVARFAVPSAGNAGGALAAYAAAAGVPALVILPRDTPRAFPEEARMYGARVELVDGTIADAGRRLAALAGEEDWFDVSTFKEPYRLEGKKTLGFEIVEELGFRYPDWIVYPTGGGTGLVGMWKAFGELEGLGWMSRDSRRPRMVSVQAEGCAPIVDAFERGAETAVPPASPATRAYGLRVPAPFADRLILAALRESGGRAVRVSEDEIASAAAEVAREEGIDACPEGGAAWAGVKKLAGERVIGPDDVVVFVNTGAGIKYRDRR